MKYLIVCIGLSVLGISAGYSQVRKKINFDKDWKFQLGHADDASKDFNYSIANIFSKTGKVSLILP